MGFIWTKVRRPGIYVPIGLPRDRLVQEALRSMARERRLADVDSAEERHRLSKTTLPLERIFETRTAGQWEEWAIERDLPLAAVRNAEYGGQNEADETVPVS